MTGGTAIAWLEILILGGLAGLVGQVIRSVAGMHKLGLEASAENVKRVTLFEPSRLAFSLMVGFAAGALASLSIGVPNGDTITPQTILGFLAAGYAGTDFIEAFVKQKLPATGANIPVPTQPQQPNQTGG